MFISTDPASVVQRQLDAYNACDIDMLMDNYAADAELFEHPSTLLASGAVALRERFTARFEEPNLHAALLGRTVMGPMVIDHEEVTRTFPDGAGKVRVIMIYEVHNGLITKVWSMVGEKTLG